jgi:phosphoglycolate phosphatase-like HAD superfamily hydrolase
VGGAAGPLPRPDRGRAVRRPALPGAAAIPDLTPVALDLDGTLLDCRARQVALATHLAGALDEEAFWTAKRAGATTAAALAAQGVPDPDAVAAAWVAEVEDERWLALDEPLPGALDALAALHAGGRAPFVLTARRHPGRVLTQVERLLGEVDVVVVAPGRAAAEKGARLAELGAAGLVGDTEADIAAAQRADVAVELVASGQRDADFLLRHGAERVHPGVTDAVAALLSRLADGASGFAPT